MSKDAYIIKFADQEEYDKYEEYLTELGKYRLIKAQGNIWVMHHLTFENSEKVKALGINISHDRPVIKAF